MESEAEPPKMAQLSIGQRIKFLLDANGGSIRKFARLLDLSDTNIRNYLERGTKPSSDVLEKILQTIPHLNPVWLLTGNGEPFLSDSDASPEKVVTSTKNNFGNTIGINRGIATATYTIADCEKERDGYKSEVLALRAQLDAATSIIASKDALIAAKDETITLLRASYNRPN